MIQKSIKYSLGMVTSLLILTGCNVNNSDSSNPETPAEESEVQDTNNGDQTTENDEEADQSEAADKTPDEDEIEELLAIELEQDLLEPSSIKALVNKQYSLPEDYVPEDLVTVEVPTVLENAEIRQLREPAADALKDMFDAAEEEDILLHARSGYRSYQTQVQLYSNYVSNHGEEAANRYSAKPGQSEHQTGLGMDVTSESVNFQLTEAFGETPEGQWVEENAHAFGYIIRYPEGKEDITGYQYEPWHLRYLGEDLATEVYESNLTYEEYLIERGIAIEINE